MFRPRVSVARSCRFALALAAAPTLVSCAGEAAGTISGPSTSSASGGGGAGGESVPSGGGGAGTGGDGQPWNGLCPAVFRLRAQAGTTQVRVAGEWQGFDLATAPVMTGPDSRGDYTATVDLPPGLHAYKLVVDTDAGAQWLLDPEQGRRKYVDHIENSAIKVRDCSKPSLTVVDKQVSRAGPGQGRYSATLAYVDAIVGGGADAGGYEVSLRKDGEPQAIAASAVKVDDNGDVAVDVQGLSDGKYRLVLRPRASSGTMGDRALLVFWIEPEPFSWQDALIYMVVTDRYINGDPANDPAPTAGAEPRGDWKGGDLQGLRQAIADGTLDQLGVRAIWLTPFQTNPDQAYLASDGVHLVTGYHGYWPVKAREVDARLGGEEALAAVVKEAHAHGIRVLQDFVINHVHQDHEYVTAHPDWFRTGCVCGTADCDWTVHALDCTFTDYMPDIDHTVPAANAQIVDDAVYWLDAFDLDGLRVDAVKHVEEVATRNLAAEIRETFEGGGTRYFLTGETAMGWNDCADPCNDDNYGRIANAVGTFGLDGQLDFVLYHAVSYRTFAWGDRGMLHADYWFSHGLSRWPAGAIMTPYIGSHDTPRFTTLADYRGQDGAHDRGIAGNMWDDTAVAPTDSEPYRRARLALAWLFALPGAPLLYAGDEHGQWGGADPNNRLMWRADAALNGDELQVLNFARSLGAARRSLPALRRGDYATLAATEDTLVLGRKIPGGDAALVGFTRAASDVGMTIDALGKLGWQPGTALLDALGGPGATVTGVGNLTLTVPAGGAVVLHP